MQHLVSIFKIPAQLGYLGFASLPLNVRKDETEIISSTLNVKSDVFFN